MSDFSEHLQIMHEHYRTDDGTWHIRECYPWEYDLQIQACIETASRLQLEHERIFLQQANIFQDRANYLRMQQQMQQSFAAAEKPQSNLPAPEPHSQPVTPPTSQPSLTPSSPFTPPQQQPISLAKKKCNQKTRQQYKKKAQAQRVTIQEVEHMDVQSSGEAAAKCARSEAAFSAGKHVFLQCIWESSQHAAISWIEMALFDEMILVQNGAIRMPRMGVG